MADKNIISQVAGYTCIRRDVASSQMKEVFIRKDHPEDGGEHEIFLLSKFQLILVK